MTTTNFPTRIETLAGQPIPQLAEKFGTPLYVYDAATIEARIREFAAFDVVRFAKRRARI